LTYAGASFKVTTFERRKLTVKQKLIMSLLLAASMLLAFSGTAVAGDPSAVKDKSSMCIGCHGIEGYRTAYPVTYNVPKIGGQSAEYIIKALQAYQNGDRTHPSMVAVAAGLSEQDIKDFAAYYSGN
jgi:cytochrome c553